ncbi:hypothetical protein [Victivallis vadensis]|uniref:hypothetical protein n=1 Tax=Victivallis vadensis TaxID=172901 RepID=UPI003AF9D204
MEKPFGFYVSVLENKVIVILYFYGLSFWYTLLHLVAGPDRKLLVLLALWQLVAMLLPAGVPLLVFPPAIGLSLVGLMLPAGAALIAYAVKCRRRGKKQLFEIAFFGGIQLFVDLPLALWFYLEVYFLF